MFVLFTTYEICTISKPAAFASQIVANDFVQLSKWIYIQDESSHESKVE